MTTRAFVRGMFVGAHFGPFCLDKAIIPTVVEEQEEHRPGRPWGQPTGFWRSPGSAGKLDPCFGGDFVSQYSTEEQKSPTPPAPHPF